jgi:hypothetical protein
VKTCPFCGCLPTENSLNDARVQHHMLYIRCINDLCPAKPAVGIQQLGPSIRCAVAPEEKLLTFDELRAAVLALWDTRA